MENRNYNAVYRIIHWSIALCMILLLGTIFLRLTWLNKDNLTSIIQSFLATTDQALTHDQAITLAKQIRKPMWNWHIYLGYVLVGLYSLRLILSFFGKMKFSNPFNKALTLKEKFQFWVYMLFYFCVAISLITGLVIVLGQKNLKDTMEEIHVLSIYYLLAFIFIHFGGVFLAELTNQKGIISKIISGTKNEKDS